MIDPTSRQAVEFLVHTARRRLDMEAAFLAELTEHEQIHHATTGTSAESFTIFEGGRLPRLEGYCRRVMETNEPWVIRDTDAEPAVRELRITEDGAFGAYIGVPVTYPDGRAFGTLCCVSHSPRPELGPRSVAVLEALADLLGFHIEQLEEHDAALGDLETYAARLTERLGEHELRLEVFRHLVDANADPTLLLHPETLFVEYANRAAGELVGTDPADLSGPVWSHHRCWDRERTIEQLGALREPAADDVRYQIDPVDGAPALDVRAQRVTTRAGTAFVLWTGRDATLHEESRRRAQTALERERAASEELRHLNTLKDTFLTAISHELRTPLTTVSGVAQTLHAGRAEGALATTLLERLIANAARLDRLLIDLLDLNRFSHGRLDLDTEFVRLDLLVREAVAGLDLDDRPIDLSLDVVELPVAPVKFERIVANLVLNAAVHTPPGEPVHVQLTRDDAGVELLVSDRGPGIPPAERRTLFEPFQQGATAPAHRPGAGIGLSLVAAFTELHGGRVWIEDGPGGEGAAFRVLLPAAPPRA